MFCGMAINAVAAAEVSLVWSSRRPMIPAAPRPAKTGTPRIMKMKIDATIRITIEVSDMINIPP